MYQSNSAAEYIYQEIRRMMIEGELKPGERIVQRGIAERFGTSNIPVIEAIRRLEQDGLVISRPNAGAQVQVWNASDIRGAYLTREALDGIACRLFIESARDEERRKLVEHDRDYRRQVKLRDPQGWLDADVALHRFIVGATKSRPLIRAVDSSLTIVQTISNAHRLRAQPGKILPPETDAHAELIKALLSDDADEAERAGRAHVRDALSKLNLWNLLADAGLPENTPIANSVENRGEPLVSTPEQG
jgi:DNA-binding GntR family transcriptional regulator